MTNTLDFSKMDKNELAIFNAKTDRKVFMSALENGSLACLPDSTGYVDTKPATNITTGSYYHGINMLLLKNFQKTNNFPTPEFITFDAIEAANKKMDLPFNNKIHLKAGSKGVSIHYRDGEEPKTIRLFNVAQLTNVEKLREYVTITKYEQRESLKNYLQENGKKYYPKVENNNSNNHIICSSTNPSEYLGQYFAAVSIGAPFLVSQDQAAQFKKNTSEFVFSKSSEGKINPFNLNRLAIAASKYCKDYLRDTFAQKAPERTTEHESKKKAPAKKRIKEPSFER